MNENLNLNLSVAKAMTSERLQDFFKDYGEIAIDRALNEGVLRDIPVIGSMLGVFRATGAVRDHIFATKILKFLNSLSSISSQDRLELVERLNKEDGFRDKVGDAIVEILDRVESERKPDLIARVFIAFVAEEITFIELQRLVVAIERLPTYELKLVRELHDGSIAQLLKLDTETRLMMSMAGLARNNGGLDGGVEIPTDLCKTFIRLNLDR